MSVTLIVRGGLHHGRRIPIGVREFLIGRDAGCHLRASSRQVGRRHCTIVTRRAGVFLRDLAEGGTLLNSRRLVAGEVQLEEGDLIGVGPLTFRVTIEKAAPAQAERPTQTTASLRTQSHRATETRPVETSARPRTAVTPVRTVRPRPPRMPDCREMLCPAE